MSSNLTIDHVCKLLDAQTTIAIWYTIYDGCDEAICYANECFASAFGLTSSEVLDRKRYHLVNPPQTPAKTIEQYKREDQHAIESGYYYSRNPVDENTYITVLKIRFAEGMLGMFIFSDVSESEPGPALENLNPKFTLLVQRLRPDLISGNSSSEQTS